MTRREAARPLRAASRDPWTAAAFIAPGFALFAVAMVYPILSAARMSLYDWNVLVSSASQFVGLDNYQRALADPVFWRALGNSGVYMVLTVPPRSSSGWASPCCLGPSHRPSRSTGCCSTCQS